jgi:hypothetical protein
MRRYNLTFLIPTKMTPYLTKNHILSYDVSFLRHLFCRNRPESCARGALTSGRQGHTYIVIRTRRNDIQQTERKSLQRLQSHLVHLAGKEVDTAAGSQRRATDGGGCGGGAGSSDAGRVNLDGFCKPQLKETRRMDPQHPKTVAILDHLACQHKTKTFGSPRGPARNQVG